MPKRRRPLWKKILLASIPYILILIVIIVLLVLLLLTSSNTINYKQFLAVLDASNGTKLQSANVTVSSDTLEIVGRYTNSDGTWVAFDTVLPKTNEIMNTLFGDANINNANLSGLLVNTSADVEIESSGDTFLTFLPSIITAVVIIGISISFIYMLSKRGGDMGMGKSKARQTTSHIKFKDVAGYVEEKQELKEIVDFLRNPKKYLDMGARPPRGVLLSGPPGTGKTLLAKAVSGEAEVSFFFVTGSEFDEVFVGLGATRVRDLFKQAKKAAPAIIYIDEIDALGAKRGGTFGGGGVRDQTINQFLAELDGFQTADNIVVIASTNKPESLDPALLRSGRFDRKIIVPAPDLITRHKILKLHASTKKMGQKIDLEDLARRMPGFTGADIENVLNEASLLAVRGKKQFIEAEDVEEAIDRVIAGPSRKSKIYDRVEKEIIAIHESGHAVVGVVLSSASKIEKITLVPRGIAGGYTLTSPVNERIIQTKSELVETIAGLLGGRAAVEIIYGDEKVTSGAQNDIERATSIARQMVTQLGMSPLGTIQYGERVGYQFLGSEMNRNYSDQTSKHIDDAIKQIINEAYQIAVEEIKKNSELLKNLTRALLKVETIVKSDIDYIKNENRLPVEIETKETDIDEDLRKRFEIVATEYKKQQKSEKTDPEE